MIRIRAAVPDDLAFMKRIASHSITAAQWPDSTYEKLFAPEAVQKRTILVVEENGETLGFVVARPAADEWEIENIAVIGTARRRGLGSHLLGEFLNQAKKAGAAAVFLEVRESNHAARALYEKWAFVQSGRRSAYYSDPLEDALVFRFSFPQKG